MTRIVLIALLGIPPCAWGQLQITSVVNSASFEAGLPRGGALATLFCTLQFIGYPGPDPGVYLASPTSALPYQLGGLQVFVNNAPAPILSVVVPSQASAQPAQVNFQVPVERGSNWSSDSALPTANSGTLTVFECDASGKCFATGGPLSPLPQAGRGGFFSDGNGFAIAQHASDYSLVTTQNPAHAGETIIVYADDFFGVWPTPPMGIPVPPQFTYQYTQAVTSELQLCCNLYLQTYTTGYTTTPAVKTLYLGLAPNMIGVEQINFVVPTNQQPGDWALFFNFGSCPATGGSGCGPIGGKPDNSSPVLVPVR